MDRPGANPSPLSPGRARRRRRSRRYFHRGCRLALATGATAAQAVRVGIDSASIAVTRSRTSVVSYQDLLRRVSLDDNAETLSLKDVVARLEADRFLGKRIVFTNGVFDILHAGHVQLLRRARALGDVLVVGLNSDASTRRLKGPTRPVNRESDRIALVSALDAVDYAVLFDEDTPARADQAIRPHVHVKGGDYLAESSLRSRRCMRLAPGRDPVARGGTQHNGADRSHRGHGNGS